MLEFNPCFQSVEVSGAQIVRAAREFVGLRYSQNTFADRDAGGKIVGFCDCAGLFLLTAMEVQLLPATFDPNLPLGVSGVSRETALKQILSTNFSRVPVENKQPGDLLVLKINGENESEFGRHMAIWTGETIIHAINEAKNLGSVREEPLEAHVLPCVWRVYRLNSLMSEAISEAGDLDG